MKAQLQIKADKRPKWIRGEAVSSPEAGLFRDCGAPLMPGEDLLSGFKRATATNPEKLMAKCAEPKAVRSVQRSMRCSYSEAVMSIYTHLRSMEHDPFQKWKPECCGLIPFLRRSSAWAAMKIVERYERSPWGLTVSMNMPIDTGYGMVPFAQVIEDAKAEMPDAVVEKSEILDILKKEFAALDDEEQAVISVHFGMTGEKGLSLLNTRKKLGFSRIKNDKILARAISKLRNSLTT